MRIAIPVDRTDMEGKVHASFGRAPFFLIYETDTQDAKFFENQALVSPGGAGTKSAQVMLDYAVDALLTPRCGEKAARVLEAAGIKLHKTDSTSIEESIAAFLEGKLPPIMPVQAELSNHGGD
ncbi:MAG: dinitrogenase iron-molybdenum cofactor biosynthesis protein [Firmicutes bacterium]|nr:dinitrogenase iron-molybdenum cofactor biosynthesis protein [Bacillota bacterium]